MDLAGADDPLAFIESRDLFGDLARASGFKAAYLEALLDPPAGCAHGTRGVRRRGCVTSAESKAEERSGSALSALPRPVGKVTIPTTTPPETLGRVAEFFAPYPEVAAVGVGSFGPIDLDERSPSFGTITTTPKPGWAGTDVRSLLASRLGPPSRSTGCRGRGPWRGRSAPRRASRPFVTSRSERASAEARSCAARSPTVCCIPSSATCGSRTIAYATRLTAAVRTTATASKDSRPAPRSARWSGLAADELSDDGLELEAEYIALGLVNVVSVLSPERIVLGGGVMSAPDLLHRVRERVRSLAAEYFRSPALGEGIAEYVVRACSRRPRRCRWRTRACAHAD